MAANLFIFFMDGVQLPQGYSHFEEAFYFLPFSSQKLSLTWSFDKTDMQSKYGTNASFAASAISIMEFFPNLSFPVTILDRYTILNSKF